MFRKITRRLSDNKAFTLIEVIVSLILAAIIAAVAGLGLVQVSQGYIFAKQNAETMQKIQIAMNRIVKELAAAQPTGTSTAITAAGTTSVSYTRPASIGSSTFVTNTISISGTLVQMSGNTGGTIINNVISSSSSFAYFDTNGAPLTAPVTGTALARIGRIDITLNVTGADNLPSNFTNSVWINESY
jgi:prepilin-type N-terminal cleavage/methylation domain-containing protein